MIVSVIIPTHNRRSTLLRVIESLERQDYPAAQLEIVVAADRCTDGTVGVLATLASQRIRYLESLRPGAAAARNAALDIARGELAVFLDDDMEAEPGLISAHVAAHQRSGETPVVAIGNAPVHVDDDDAPIVKALAASYTAYFAALATPRGERRAGGLLGGNFSVRTAVLRGVGGFDESLMLREDLELGIRLRKAGVEPIFCAKAVATQYVTLSMEQMIARAPLRAEADVHLLEQCPEATAQLEVSKAMTPGMRRRRFHAFWLFGPTILPPLRLIRRAVTENFRLGSWQYQAEYARALRRRVRWRDLSKSVDAASPRRVLHLLGTGRTGGVESFVRDIVQHLDPARFQCEVCILGEGGPVADEIRNAGIRVSVLASAGRNDLRAWARYARVLARGRFELLHAHSGGRLHRRIARKAYRMRVITHVHGVEASAIGHVRAGDDAARNYFDRATSESDLVLTCSAWLLNSIRCLVPHLGAPSLGAPSLVFQDGVDLERFVRRKDSAVRTELGIPNETMIVGFVGRFVEQKGLDMLIEVAAIVSAKVPGVEFVVVGDGPLRPVVEKQARDAGLYNVRMVGEQSDPAHYMSIFDILLLPSRWEPFGIVSLEAMALGIPVVGFAIDGVPEAVADGETGILVAAGDLGALAERVLALLQNQALRESLGKRGRARVEAMFNIADVARSLEATYESVLEESLAG